jgi:hypothetical protein
MIATTERYNAEHPSVKDPLMLKESEKSKDYKSKP